jgi:muconate cycloisomerase
MARIGQIETFIVDVPIVRAHVMAVAAMRRQTMTLVRVVCTDGIIGWGEGTTIGGLSYGEESPEGIKLAIDTYMAPLLLAAECSTPASLMAQIDKCVVGNRFARNAVETALLDAHSRRLGVCFSELIGGAIRTSLPVLWTLASGDTRTDIAEAKDMIAARRHNAFKLKIGKRPLRDDVAHVAAIKRALGASISIRVDINQAWSEYEARAGIAMLADAGVDLVEQPIARTNWDGMSRLTAASPVPIMADEMVCGPASALTIAKCHAADVLAVKIAQSGGPVAGRAVASIADSSGLGVYGGTMLEGPIGTLASAHLCATLPTLAFGTELFGPLLQGDSLLVEPIAYRDFELHLPAGPGLGLTIDEDRLGFFRRDGDAPTTFLVTA